MLWPNHLFLVTVTFVIRPVLHPCSLCPFLQCLRFECWGKRWGLVHRDFTKEETQVDCSQDCSGDFSPRSGSPCPQARVVVGYSLDFSDFSNVTQMGVGFWGDFSKNPAPSFPECHMAETDLRFFACVYHVMHPWRWRLILTFLDTALS